MTPQDILDQIAAKEVLYVDLRFTDMRGKLQHVTFDIDMVDEEFLTEGTMFDGSSIAGWKAINESDMLLRPDLTNSYIDPFYQQTTLCLFCDILNPDTGEPYNRDPRGIARKALTYVKSSGVGDQVYFGQGLRGRQHGPPARAQGRLFPRQSRRQRPGPPRRDAGGHGRAGAPAGEAPP
jgi:glutamine synthetase